MSMFVSWEPGKDMLLVPLVQDAPPNESFGQMNRAARSRLPKFCEGKRQKTEERRVALVMWHRGRFQRAGKAPQDSLQ
jgi:hypothetical protein